MHYCRGGKSLNVNSDGAKPIYVQIAQWIESEILNYHFEADEKVYSQYQLADMFTINPATAAKGLAILVDENILYKKRGLGMFVTEQARELILQKRKNQNLKQIVSDLVNEAYLLGVSESELIEMVKAANKEKG